MYACRETLQTYAENILDRRKTYEDISENVAVFFPQRLTSFLNIDRSLMKSNQCNQQTPPFSVACASLILFVTNFFEKFGLPIQGRVLIRLPLLSTPACCRQYQKLCMQDWYIMVFVQISRKYYRLILEHAFKIRCLFR